MSDKARTAWSLVAALLGAVVTLGIEIAQLGPDGLSVLVAMSIVGIALAIAGVVAAAVVGAIAFLVVYVGIWLVQEAFGLQPARPAR